MGGLDWVALPVVASILGYSDIEMLITELVAIRDRFAKE